MNRTITFNELRKIKDSLPSGSMHRIADELGMSVDTVRNFFGGYNFKEGKSVGIHLEPGPDGGLVMLDDTTVLDRALSILKELNIDPKEQSAEEPAVSYKSFLPAGRALAGIFLFVPRKEPLGG